VLKINKENIRATGVTTVVMVCTGCNMQIVGGLESEGSLIRLEHSATLVPRNLRK
jgi:Fe-S oxidoreductase